MQHAPPKNFENEERFRPTSFSASLDPCFVSICCYAQAASIYQFQAPAFVLSLMDHVFGLTS